MQQSIRVRFAPSPTGPLHIGGVRTALYNYLFARKHQGTFILRIEDTDQNRFVPGAEQYIIDSLSWCGLSYDEGPDVGGPYAPYRQSERMSIYRTFVHQLIDSGHAYYAFDTEKELEERRAHPEMKSMVFQYDQHTRLTLRNSLSLPAEEVRNLLSAGYPFVVRVKIPADEIIVVNDLVRGLVSVNTSTLDDKVLFKSDGMPTYHLANVVDDYLMKITHVIRGEEWLPSAPLHVLLYRFFGWESVMPQFAHLPLILKPDGNGKLSKRDGDRLGFPVFPIAWKDPITGEIFSGYRESGYLPTAFLNIMAHLGWNSGSEKEIFSLQELIDSFSLDRVGKHGAKFDFEKARWYNHQYLMMATEDTLSGFLKTELSSRGLNFSNDYVRSVIHLIRDRVFLIPDLWNCSWFFFTAPKVYDPQVFQKIWKSDTEGLIRLFSIELKKLPGFTHEGLHLFIQEFCDRNSVKMGQVMNPLRLLTVGSNQGPGMQDIILLLGKDEFLSRIDNGLGALPAREDT